MLLCRLRGGGSVCAMKTETAGTTGPAGPSRQRVWAMFDRFCRRYDLANRVISFGRDMAWRRTLARFAPRCEGLDVLDLATGTGDQLLALHQAGLRWRRAVGLDMASGMLDRARVKSFPQGTGAVEWLEGDAVDPPFEAGSFDFITMSYGIRNVVDVPRCLHSMLACLRPGGVAAILEASRPEHPLIAWGHRLFLRLWVQGVGGLVSGDPAAFRYLPETILTFPSGEDFLKLMREAGFEDCGRLPLMFGAVTVYHGRKGQTP